MGTNLLEAALSYAAMGWLVFPVHSWVDGACTCGTDCGKDAAKHPLTAHGCKDATTDAGQLRRWWDEAEGLANIGLATGGRSCLLVLDVDGDEGEATLLTLEAAHGPLPPTPTVQTGGDGTQFYFRYPPGTGLTIGSRILPGLDFRGEGGYVVAPPSLHRSGNRYHWLADQQTPVADAPSWLVALLLGAKARTLTVAAPTPDLTNSPGAPDGSRNNTLCRLIGVHLARDEDPDDIEALALAWAETCDPPMREKDVLRALASLEKSHRRKQQQPTTRSHPATSDGPAKLRTDEEHRQEATTGWELVCSFAPSQGPTGNGDGVSSHLRSLRSREAEASEMGGGRVFVVDAQAQAYQSKREEVAVEAWPQLHPDALHGLAGQIVRAIAPETEADEAGVLLTLLACVGNAIGNSPSFAVGTDRHGTNLFVCLVGDTASGKGLAWGIAKHLLRLADAKWATECIGYGLSSGEGLVERLQDHEPEAAPHTLRVPEAKRLLCYESELAKPITALRREGNTLSAILRAAWDAQTLEVMTRGKSKLKASNAHVSVVAHITPEECDKLLRQSVEVANGFANRFLWCVVRRSKLLPHGGNAGVLDAFAEPLAKAIARAKGMSQCRRSSEADALWERIYAVLSEARPGAFGRATDRARPQVVRLALLYALLDGSQTVGGEHLRAALAVWGYCEASARRIFGEGINNKTTTPAEEPLALRLLNAIQARPGINRTGLHDATGRHARAEEIDRALAWLLAQELAHPRECRPEGGGRVAECWHPGPAPSEPPCEDCDEREGTSQATVPPEPEPVSSPRGCEETPSVPAVAVSSHSSPLRTLTLEELVEGVRSMAGRFVWQSDEKGEGCVVVVEAPAPIPQEIAQACQQHQETLQDFVPDKDDRCYESYLRQQKDDKGNPCFNDEQIAGYLAFSREIRDAPAPDRESPLIPRQ